VAAIGTHEPDAREVDTALVRRSALWVEARAVLPEAGDLVAAFAETGPLPLANLSELVTGAAVVPVDRPRLFKGVGMAWQDLAVAAAQYELHGGEPPGPGPDPLRAAAGET
jgi:ornithine cyclodeaminase